MDVDRLMLPQQRPGPTREPNRSRARRHRPPPQRDVEFDGIELAELRRRRAGFNDEESRVSYWRRIIQARIDLIEHAGSASEAGRGLERVLADSRSAHRRIAALSVDSASGLPPLPDLAELWQQMTPDDPRERAVLVSRLREAEERLSEYRHELHHRIDHVTGELIARYRENPTLALTALNERLHGG
jgi:hypothetical protein